MCTHTHSLLSGETGPRTQSVTGWTDPALIAIGDKAKSIFSPFRMRPKSLQMKKFFKGRSEDEKEVGVVSLEALG